MKHPYTIWKKQSGSSLIEVLVAILLLSFGLLSLGAMLTFAVQAPKLSAYHATAANLANNYIERMRANTTGFAAGAATSGSPGATTYYRQDSNYTNSESALTLPNTLCTYTTVPDCSTSSGMGLAQRDFWEIKVAVRANLPAGGLLMKHDASSGTNSSTEGNLWIIWNEPDSYAAFSPTSSDNCPTEVTSTYTNPAPRCLYVRFKL
jgi:type IV pilus assembly protein PilV